LYKNNRETAIYQRRNNTKTQNAQNRKKVENKKIRIKRILKNIIGVIGKQLKGQIIMTQRTAQNKHTGT